MISNHVAFFIVLFEWSIEGSELDSCIAVLHPLSQRVYHIFFEQVKGTENWKESTNFFLEDLPAFLWVFHKVSPLLIVHHCQIADSFDKLFLCFIFFPCLGHGDPSILLSFFLSTDLEALQICSQIHNRIIDNMLGILPLINIVQIVHPRSNQSADDA